MRCDLSQAAAPIQVNYLVDDSAYEGTQYQCADARHTINGLAAIGRELLAAAIQVDGDLDTTYEVIDG